MRPVIVWFRQDLRVGDNPALAAAAASGQPVVCAYILDDGGPGRWRPGGASRWWLHGSLAALADRLRRLGGDLVLRRGAAAQTLSQLAAETGATAVYLNRLIEPFWRDAEDRAAELLRAGGVMVHAFDAQTLFPPGQIRGRQGQPLRVFTPFWRACLAAAPPRQPLPAPQRLLRPERLPASETLDDWRLRPTAPDWAAGMRETWTPGEAAAQARLASFVDRELAGYAAERNRPEPAATSRLSPHLHFGEISPRQVWHVTMLRADAEPRLAGDAQAFLREVGWREFCLATLQDAPDMAEQPLQRRFARFPWAEDGRLFRAWSRGRTGYPIVDAGMRQLWHTGWMHNRVRMIVASFLVKDLLQPWQAGEAWFWDTLVDADLANNAGGWQWVAGCGTDAAPYFRVFNPVTQGEKFDATGAYVRRWLPELAALPNGVVHRPWTAAPLDLAAAGIRIGIDYPAPIVDHGVARQRALAAFASVGGSPQATPAWP